VGVIPTTTTISASFFSPRIMQRRHQLATKKKKQQSAAAASPLKTTTTGGGGNNSWGSSLTRFLLALTLEEEIYTATVAAATAAASHEKPVVPQTTTTTTTMGSTKRATAAATINNNNNKQEPPPAEPITRTGRTKMSNWIDPCILQFTAQTPTDLMDKVLSSYARLLLIANWLLACTVLMHSAIAEFFLGPDASSHEPIGIYLCFKLLLISSVVAQDHLDWLILLSWYTCLQFLRSLHSLSSNAIANARGSGQIPRPGVWKLLLTILALDGVACAACVGLLHEAGLCMILVLTCDCLLLAIDVLTHLMQCKTVVNEFRHQEQMAVLEHEQLMGYDRDLVIEQLERSRLHQANLLDGGIFWLQFLFDMITIFHYLHIWTLHRLQLTMIDGVLALQLWSAFNSVNAKIAEKRKLNKIAKDMDEEFQDASELDIKKAAACGDVCCICLSSMSWIGLRNTHVKKLKCGHMYHTSCLREVVERARSMDAARCPMCRNTIHADRRPQPPPEQPQQQPLAPEDELQQVQPPLQMIPVQPPPAPQQQPQPAVGDEPPIFRFTASIPWLPAVSFEVVRRPDNDTVTVWRRFFGMTEAEEQVALQRLSDMFPQYDRNELLTALRERGSDQLVAEAILAGALAPPVVR
jgi:hypothetical protein